MNKANKISHKLMKFKMKTLKEKGEKKPKYELKSDKLRFLLLCMILVNFNFLRK